MNVNVGVVSLVEVPGLLVMVVSGGTVSTVKVRLAGVASTLPAPSMARTSKVCEPSDRAAVVKGVVQAANAAASKRHWNVEPASVEVKVKVGVLSLVVLPAAGPPVMFVSGGVASTVKVRLAGVGSVLLAGSVARTSKVCAPSDSADVVNGVVQAAKAAASMRHWNVEPASVEVKVKVGVLSLVVLPAAGPPVMEVSGGWLSTTVETVKVRLAGSGRRCPRSRWHAPRRCAGHRPGRPS